MKDTHPIQPQINPTHVGKPISRLEGAAKVTGQAKYAAEYHSKGMLYGYVVNSPITKGTIVSAHGDDAMAVPGVVKVYTHANRPRVAKFDLKYADMDAPPGTVFKPLDDNLVRFNGQPIALVVAKSFETARYAASLVRFEFEEQPFETILNDNLEKARTPKIGMATALKPPPPKPTGDFDKAFESADFKVEAEYWHGAEHHNPLEMFATTTVHDKDGRLRVYTKTQGTINDQLYIAHVFGLQYNKVNVIAPYVGGGFGSGLRPQHQLFFSVMAALDLGKDVSVSLDRKQMFTFGHRPQTYQKVRIGSDKNGQLLAMNHLAIGETSTFEDYSELVSDWSHKLYPIPNTRFEYQLAPLDLHTPLDMRAPGGSTAMHAIECAMDELACQLKIDPLELRMRNYSETDPTSQKPFTSKELMQCFHFASEKFGWKGRSPEPRSMQRGNKLVGYGMAAGIWDAYQFPARVKVEINSEGKLTVENATTDIGTGTYTVMAQIAADGLGLSLEDVTVNYGESKMPFSMFQGGSATTASVGNAISIAIESLKEKLWAQAKKLHGEWFSGCSFTDVAFVGGALFIPSDPTKSLSLKELAQSAKGGKIGVTKMGKPHVLKLRNYSKATHSVSFVEVEVDRELGTITVTRALTAVAAGKIINPKTAKSQILGSMVWGISKALHEESLLDPKLGKFMNANLAEYHIPVHSDIGDLEVLFAEEKDEVINELGVKGVGEIGMVAMPAAISNAVYHATGKRVYQLPIRLEMLL